MQQRCVLCVVKSTPLSQFVVSARSIIVLNVWTPTLVLRDRTCMGVEFSYFTVCRVLCRESCGLLGSTCGASLGEGESGG